MYYVPMYLIRYSPTTNEHFFLVITYGPTLHVCLHQHTFVVSGLIPRGFFFLYSHAAQTMNEASCQ